MWKLKNEGFIIFRLKKYLLKRLEFHEKNFYLEINIASTIRGNISPRVNTLPCSKTRYFFRHNYFETASSRYTMKKRPYSTSVNPFHNTRLSENRFSSR